MSNSVCKIVGKSQRAESGFVTTVGLCEVLEKLWQTNIRSQLPSLVRMSVKLTRKLIYGYRVLNLRLLMVYKFWKTVIGFVISDS